MKEKINNLFKAIAAWPGLVVAIGGCILLTSLVHVPSAWDALNYFDPPKRFLWSIMALVLAGIWSLRTSRFTRPPLLLSFGLLTWIIVRTLFKPHPDVELEVLFTWTVPVLLFILAGSMDQARAVRIIGGCLVLAGVIQASLMLLQRFGYDPFFFDTTSVMDYKPGRMIGTIGYQNQAVDFLALSAAGILMVSRSPFLRLAFMVAMLFAAGLTGNRTGIVAFTLALLISQALSLHPWEGRRGAVLGAQSGCPPSAGWKHPSLWRTRKKRLVAAVAILGACGVVAIMALMPETGSRFREILTDFRHSPAVGSRILMARIGGAMFLEKPWTGWGAGEYAFQYLDRLGAVLPDKKTYEVLHNVVFVREAHNDYLQFAVEFGIVGVLLVAGLLAVAVMHVARVRNPSARWIPAMAFILVYMAVSALFSFPWQTSMGGPLAGLLLGWLWPAKGTAARDHSVSQDEIRVTFRSRAAKAGLVAVSLLLMGWFMQDAYLNTEVPYILTWSGPSEASNCLPSYAYRYHALVGASYASRTTQGDYIPAESELMSAQQGYRDIPLWNNLGHVKAKMNKWDEARDVYEKWARCGLDHSNALLNLSIANERTGRIREAADTLTQRCILWRNPSPAEIKRLAVLQLQAGNPRSAESTLRRFRRMWTVADSRTVSEIENIMGAARLALGDKQEAAKWFRSALDKNPDLKSAKRNLEGLSNRVPAPRLQTDCWKQSER